MSYFIDVFTVQPVLFISLSFLFAAVLGSFVNVVIHRLPIMLKRQWQQECNQYLRNYHPDQIKKLDEAILTKAIDPYPQKYNLLVPASTCPKCQTQIRAWHNLPIIGWLILRGKCANCQVTISKRYPIVEFISGLLIATLAWRFGPSMTFLATTVMTLFLLALTGIDIDEMLLPDNLTYPLLWLGLIFNLNQGFVSLEHALIGTLFGYLSLWSIFWVFKLLTGKEGMGYGDFKLMAVFGAWLGWQMLPLIILLSSLFGIIFAAGLILFKRHDPSNPIPFGPYIAAAGWVAVVWGQDIVSWYLTHWIGVSS